MEVGGRSLSLKDHLHAWVADLDEFHTLLRGPQ